MAPSSMTTAVLLERMCRVMAERQFWTAGRLVTRLGQPTTAARVIGNMLATFGDYFEYVPEESFGSRAYRLAKGCVTALYSPTTDLRVRMCRMMAAKRGPRWWTSAMLVSALGWNDMAQTKPEMLAEVAGLLAVNPGLFRLNVTLTARYELACSLTDALWRLGEPPEPEPGRTQWERLGEVSF